MKTTLEAQGMEVVATVLPDECRHKMLVKKDTKVIRDSGAEAVVGMACGDGVQTVADNLPPSGLSRQQHHVPGPGGAGGHLPRVLPDVR